MVAGASLCISLGLLCLSEGLKGKGRNEGDFPGGPVVKTPHFRCRGRGFDP